MGDIVASYPAGRSPPAVIGLRLRSDLRAGLGFRALNAALRFRYGEDGSASQDSRGVLLSLMVMAHLVVEPRNEDRLVPRTGLEPVTHPIMSRLL